MSVFSQLHIRHIGICVAVMGLFHGLVIGGDWPQFQGPLRNGTAPDTGLLRKWPAEGPRELWKVSVGAGFGGVAIHSSRVYMLDRIEKTADVLRCFDLLTGKEEWRYAYEAPGSFKTPGSRSHPSVDDKYVFTVGPMGDLHCFNKTTHKPLWRRNIRKEFGGANPIWAISQAPALYKDLVIVAPVGTKAGMVAFRKGTGAVAWMSKPFPGKIGYASPVVTTIAGVDQVLTDTTSAILGVDVGTGEILWGSADWKCMIPIVSPSHLGGGRVFVSGGYFAGAIMLQVEKKGAKFTARTVFRTKDCNCQVHQPVLYRGHLYMNGNDTSKEYGMICMDLDGNLKWQTGKAPGFYFGGLLLADDMIYIVDGNTGDLCLVKPDPGGYREVARANFLSGPKIWATPAMSDGKILIRDQAQLKCVDLRAP